jgi:hypothetical protein
MDMELQGRTEGVGSAGVEQVRFEEPEAGDTHPWRWFVTPEHPPEEYEGLRRTLRYAHIDLQKFWVEFSSAPVFLTALKCASVRQMENVVEWLQASPDWKEFRQTRLARQMPAVASPAARRLLVEFHRDAQALRAVRAELATKLERLPADAAGLARLATALGEAAGLARREGVEPWAPPHIGLGLADARTELERVERMERFFARTGDETGAPMPVTTGQAGMLLEAIDAVAQLPRALVGWRRPAILGAASRATIVEWNERAAPLRERRRRLAQRFRLDEPIGPETLERIAGELLKGGPFRRFRGTYRDALAAYADLRVAPVEGAKPASERDETRAKRLREWAELLRDEEHFDETLAGRAFFGDRFDGVDTDFDAALEANAWAAEVRARFLPDGPEGADAFTEAVCSWALAADAAGYEAAVAAHAGTEIQEIRRLLAREGVRPSERFDDLVERAEARLEALTRLEARVREAGLRANFSMSSLGELHERAEEARFLTARMDGNEALRGLLGPDYRGPDTDLNPVEQALAYVRSIHAAPVPDDLKMAFLSGNGPQRLADTRQAFSRPLTFRGAVHEHFRKLESATRGRVRALAGGRELEEAPIPELLDRLQDALREQLTLDEYGRGLRARAGLG